MIKQEVSRIDLKKILDQKAPSLAKKIPAFVVKYLIKIIHQDEINYLLETYHDKYGVEFMTKLVEYFDITLELIGEENFPKEGRYIFASNHPLGGLDGICLSAIIGQRYEGKVKYLVNDILYYLTNLQSIFIPINKHGSQAKENAQMIEEAYDSDNQIITFPAGLCSRKQKGIIQDLEWKKSFIQKAVSHKRDIVPLFFEASNSNFFYRLANIRKALGIGVNIEMLYLPDEMFGSKHKTFRVYVGKPIPWQTFDKQKKPIEWAAWVKEIVYKQKYNK